MIFAFIFEISIGLRPCSQNHLLLNIKSRRDVINDVIAVEIMYCHIAKIKLKLSYTVYGIWKLPRRFRFTTSNDLSN